MSWFDVDKEGLAKLIAHRGKVFLLHELIQNAWDTNCTQVSVVLTPIPNRAACDLVVVDDDPDGFKNISHAYTLFAESEKKADPSKRGRFNFGEKIVLALCESATIMSTRETVEFGADGVRRMRRQKTEAGSVFTATVRMTRDEYEEVCQEIKRLIVPAGVVTTFNHELLPSLVPLRQWEDTLATEVADGNGDLRPTRRRTCIEAHVAYGPGYLYEMGIPVVEIGGPWNVNVMQKVPLNLQRDNVRPAYLRDLRASVLNNTYDRLLPEDTTRPWIGDALEDEAITPEAVCGVVTKRFGKQVVAADPSDVEAMRRATAQGYTVVSGRTFSKEQWANIRKAEAIQPAGAVFPTPKPYSTNPDAPLVDVIPEKDWTRGMREVAQLSRQLALVLLDAPVNVTFVRSKNGFAACYAPGALDFNVNRLGYQWFDDWFTHPADVWDLLIHEFGHHYSDNHLSDDYYKALTRLGGKLTHLALTRPELFEVKQ